MKLSKPIQIALVIIVVISILGFAGWKLGYVEVLKTAIEIQKQRSASKEDKEILNKVSKIIDLPTDIIPVMAVVTDPEALQKEHPTLFKKAQKGDKIIIYPNTIIVYSVSENKILGIGPVKFEGTSETATIKVALINGTNNPNIATAFEQKLLSKYQNLKIEKRVVSKNMYSDTLIVNVKDAADIVKTISDSENYRTQTEIPGEDLPADVDIVIIIGADQDN